MNYTKRTGLLSSFILFAFVSLMLFPGRLHAQNKKKGKGKAQGKKKKKGKKPAKQASDKEAKQAIEKFKKAIQKAQKTADVVVAARKLGNVKHPRVASFILQMLQRSKRDSVLIALLDALQSSGDFRNGPALAKFLPRYRNPETATVYEKILETLGKLGSRRVFKQLMSAFERPSTNFIKAASVAVRALAELNDWRAISRFVDKMEEFKQKKLKWDRKQEDPPEEIQQRFNILWPSIRDALQTLTDKNFTEANKWRQWYLKHKEEVKKNIQKQQREEQKNWQRIQDK